MEYEKIIIGDKVYRLIPEDDYKADCMLALAAGAEPERAKTGYERVEIGETYFSEYFSGSSMDDGAENDDFVYAHGDYVNDRQLYDDNKRAISIYRRMRQWQALNDDAVDIYNPETEKWHIIYYDMDMRVMRIVVCIANHDVYFSTKKKAEEALEVFKDDLMWLHTQYRRRLDESKRD